MDLDSRIAISFLVKQTDLAYEIRREAGRGLNFVTSSVAVGPQASLSRVNAIPSPRSIPYAT